MKRKFQLYIWCARLTPLSHVEAISNLAATLLALNRKEEALHHWLKAVKLRPSYFEAVEHLIGLLCGNHRAKEAVSIIEYVERSLRTSSNGDYFKPGDHFSDTSSSRSRSSSVSTMESIERAVFDYDDGDGDLIFSANSDAKQAGYGSSGYDIAGAENGRMLALVHAKGNMLYALGDNAGAANAFEDAILVAAGRRRHGIQSLMRRILSVFADDERHDLTPTARGARLPDPILLLPDKALQTAKLVFPHHGSLPGLEHVPAGIAKKAAISTTSNSLLSLAKIYQDGMSSTGGPTGLKSASGVRDILALYYLSLSLQPSPSTANNVGILLASVQQSVPRRVSLTTTESQVPDIPGVVPGSGIALALAYYNYGLNLDARHAHLYTNLGSLLKDIGQLPAAIKMYEQAVQCDGNFDIALANLANAVKDQGRISDAIGYYRRAVKANPDFAEAVCGLANAQNSVCGWTGRGGVVADHGTRDRWHVDDKGMLVDALNIRSSGSGWIHRVVEIVQKQLKDGENWGRGTLSGVGLEKLCQQLTVIDERTSWAAEKRASINTALKRWANQKWEGARIVRLVERAIKRLVWQWYQDRYLHQKEYNRCRYARPQLPSGLSVPSAPTVLPFHTFTCPLSAKQIRQISQRNALRISCSTLRSSWLPATVYKPPAPPKPHLNVGYVSSDFNNHPLAHLMQSVFGFHNPSRVKAFCYATTASDSSVHRKQIEQEAPVFHDASSWPIDRLVQQIVNDGIHILINLNGYTRGARNEVFAARPAPIHMSFMGFAGTLGAEWCDYILADEISIPVQTLSPWRRNVDVEDRLIDDSNAEDQEDWVYGENIIFSHDTFFCCDHRQSAPDSQESRLSWEVEQEKRWQMRKELFPTLADDAIILGNFNQLYKVCLSLHFHLDLTNSILDRAYDFPHLAPHPSPHSKSHPLAPSLPRPRRDKSKGHCSSLGR
jgi:tetratricopeptide (TPR) repeat protein